MSEPVQQVAHGVLVFQRRVTAHFRIGTGAQAFRNGTADLQGGVGAGVAQGLGIGVDGQEFHAFQVLAHHVLDGVTAAATHAHHLNDGFLLVIIHQFKHKTLSALALG
jgi:hypothetical protein